MTPTDWTDADPATLPRRWRDPEAEAPDECQRCGATIDRGALCEDCTNICRLRAARR